MTWEASWITAMAVVSRFVLAGVVALAATPAAAQDDGECPNPEGLRLTREELDAKLLAHKKWIDEQRKNPGIPGKAVLCNVDLTGSDLAGAYLPWANLTGVHLNGADLARADLRASHLEGADLRGANLTGARLNGANLAGADLSASHLEGADLRGADLTGADLRASILVSAQLVGTNLERTKLAFVPLAGATYAPIGLPDSYVEGIRGLSTIHIPYDETTGDVSISALIQLRELLQKAGLRDREREATYAIEHNRTHHALAARQHSLAVLEAGFRLVFFEWPVAYGLYPGRALLILLGLIGGFALVYLIPLTMTNSGGIHRVWPEGRLEATSSAAKWCERVKVERLRPQGWWDLNVLVCALQFSVLSAFHLGWRELNIGDWISRVQTHEYTLRATGWVRTVAGIQSLLSVYLLALWVLTYFGRPFH